jgi:hypothetical protein
MKLRDRIGIGGKKGITIIWLALFMLPLLIMLAGMALDIAYMYNVKNQLQVAADASALAGAANLDGTNAVSQGQARQEAWKFACKNTAGDEGNPSDPNYNPLRNVFLVTNKTITSMADCDSPPIADDLNIANNADGDIVVGNWNATLSPKFDPSRTPVNAVQVVARRNGTTPGMSPVHVFWGQIFRLIGGDWSFLNAVSTGIAAKLPRATAFVAVGSRACTSVSPTGCIYPTICTIDPPKVLVTEPTSAPDDQKFGWTSLLIPPGSAALFNAQMCGTSPFEDVCSASGIWGVSGTTTSTRRNFESLMFDPNFDAANKEKDPSGNVTGWWVMLPQNDISDPMFGPDPHPVVGYVLVRIIAVCAPGVVGCRGYDSPPGLCGPAGLYPNDSLVLDKISCISCGSAAVGLKAALVK